MDKAIIGRIVESGEIEINDRIYKITKMSHKNRLKIFGYFSSIRTNLQNNDMSYLGTDEFLKIQDIIFKHVLFNDSTLERIDNHFDKYGADFLQLIAFSLMAFSYPFMQGLN